jgi:GT2 family glycosyltransferase
MIDVSVVIPTFRREAQLIEAIDSVLAQRVATQIIVMDDSPEGSARTAVGRYSESQVSYFLHQPATGGIPAAVRNAGAKHARGRLVHFLDDDDRVAPGFYRTALKTFAADPKIGMVFGRIAPFTTLRGHDIQNERDYFARAAHRARIAARLPRFWLSANLLFMPTMLVNSACIVRRECIAPVGGYDLRLGLNEDLDFHSRVARKFGYRFIDQIVLNYRISPDSLMHSRSNDDKLLAAYRTMHAQYRAQHGTAEFIAMKLLARTVLKFV